MKARTIFTWTLLLCLFCVALMISCGEEDDDGDDDDDDDDAASDDDDAAAGDDDDDQDYDEVGSDFDEDAYGGSCCAYGPDDSCPSGIALERYAWTARQIFERHPELKQTAYNLLITQGMIDWISEPTRSQVVDLMVELEVIPAR